MNAQPTEPKGALRVGSLFSGIGGLDLGLERAGMQVAWQCEADEYCRAVLRKHWPDVPCYGDIRDINSSSLESVEVLAGGFPCQPVSLVGRGKAQADERWLWPEFERLVGELRPRYVLVENVPGLATRGLGIVVGSLAALGYDTEWDVVSAASVGAAHLRERIFVVAYASGPGRREVARGAHGDEGTDARGAAQEADKPRCCSEGRRAGTLADPDDCGRDGWPGIFRAPGRRELENARWWSVEPDVGRVAHGVPGRVDRLRALGNAVVPQVAEFVGRLILERETNQTEGERC